MNLRELPIWRVTLGALSLTTLTLSSGAAETVPAGISAKELATSLSVLQEGRSYVRLRLEVKQPADTTKITLQLQIKERRTKREADLVYQVLWPKERKGESVLLHQTEGEPSSGWLFVPPEKPRPLSASQMSDALFSSDLSYQDVIENFFGWENQSIVGREVLNRVDCLILESKPGKVNISNYSKVRSWIDFRRLVPLRVEKYLPSGQLARRIETTRVASDDKGRSIPADLTVRGSQKGSVTDLDGSRIRHDVAYADREFTPEGMQEVLPPPSSPE
ncbi:MAG: outer membrane lipoprotein-sorting protein [Verrucomicrobia bacterium]|nr:outer membrane lipoprotein-sorting protein [Verrucomicrobiota bacterium]